MSATFERLRELDEKKQKIRRPRQSFSEFTQAVDSKRKELEQILAKIEEYRRVHEENEAGSNSPKSWRSRLQQQQYHHPTLNRDERPPEEQGFPHCKLVASWPDARFSGYPFCLWIV
ncbi:hypothetical protein MLD38_016434 [Melastoma candidum]|uniref:Uncharacterized protein n=1 Tax=Melastoma candidum TaxID=119954 RepID=A0ACB9RJJ5_9MYRT|nr:hypothetical protein MLD38_016434 [Melastoma candidum]